MSALSNNLRLVGSQRFSETVCLPHQRPAVFNHKLSIPQVWALDRWPDAETTVRLATDTIEKRHQASAVATQARKPVALQERSVRLDSAVLDRPAAPDAVEIPDDLTSTSQVPLPSCQVDHTSASLPLSEMS